MITPEIRTTKAYFRERLLGIEYSVTIRPAQRGTGPGPRAYMTNALRKPTKGEPKGNNGP